MTAESMSQNTWKARVLVCDDEDIQRNIMKEILASAGHPVAVANGVDEAQRVVTESEAAGEPFDLVLTDLKMPADTEGLRLLEWVRERSPETEVILMTAFSTVRSAVKAMKLGAFEYLPKPFDKERLLHVVEQASEKLALVHENRRLRQIVTEQGGVGNMVGSGARMQELFRIIRRVSQTDTTCLIRGESGTGKELVARAIHTSGGRSTQPFIAINCAAIPETLIESELFGHEKGVFTGATTAKCGRFEEVGTGTLFLDEIGSMKYDLQAKLLRVIQEREFCRVGSSELIPFHGRIVAATAQDLEALVADNAFREDLYFRLNVVPLEIPPLRDRKEDIPLLVDRFIERGAERLGTDVRLVTPQVLERFEAYGWPGNVRELENCIERMMVLGEGEALGEELLPPAIRGEAPPLEIGGRLAEAAFAANPAAGAPGGAPGDEPGSESGGNGVVALPREGVVLEDLEADLIRQALDRSGGRIEPAAQLLGITYKTLQYRIKKYDLKATQEGAKKTQNGI